MSTLPEALRPALVWFLLLSPAAPGQQAAPLEEDFLLFLDEWVDEAGEVVAPAEFESLQGESAPAGETGGESVPLEDKDG